MSSDKKEEVKEKEELIGKPEGREYTLAEEETAKSEMNFYGSSAWCKMVAEWQKDHPISKKTYTQEELEESQRIIAEANESWRKIKAERETTRLEALGRIGRDS